MDNYKFLDINGAKIKYAEYGQGFPIVFVHAGIADSRMWDEQIEPFSKHYRVITYDMRGFGMSPPISGKYSHHEDLLALLDALSVDHCVLVGCSKGGSIVMDAALAAPGRTAGLVVIGGIVHGLELENWEDFPEPKQWEEAVAAFKAGDLEKANEMDVQMWVDGFNQPVGRASEAVREKVREMNAIVLQNELDGPEAEQKILEPKAGTRLNEFTMPVLFMSGSLDEPLIIYAAQKMVAQMPQADYKEIEGTAHLPNMEAPEEFNRIVLEFLRGAVNLD